MTGSHARSHHEVKADITEQELFAAANGMIQEYLTGKLHRSETGHLIEAFERLIEQHYPNPDKIDCPTTEYLIQLTNGSGVSELAIAHVKRCAPCFRRCTDLLNRGIRNNCR